MQKTERKVGIIIPVRDNWSYTRQCIRSIVMNTEHRNYEIIVIDNNSVDDTKDELHGYLKGFIDLKALRGAKIVSNSDNKNFSISNNEGRANTDADFLVLLNNDTIVTKGWLTAMLNVFGEEKNVGIVGARLLFPGTELIQHAGVVFMPDGSTDHAHYKLYREDPLVTTRKEYPAVTGACLMIPTEIYDLVGGLDERYFWGWEDIDLANRVRREGYRVIYEPAAIVYHYCSQTPGRYDFENQNFNLYAKEWILNETNNKDTDKDTN